MRKFNNNNNINDMMINNMMIDNNNIKNGYNYKITIISILVKIKKNIIGLILNVRKFSESCS